MNKVEKTVIDRKKVSENIFPGAVINNDLKKYKDHPVIRKKMQRGMETLKKAGLL